MPVGINPMVDCVFKALLGSEENKNLLIHFLNAVLELKGDARIIDVTLLNPFNERTFQGDKQTVVDVKALDGLGRYIQIEVQRSKPASLEERIFYTWCRMVAGQIKEGEDFGTLRPTVSIWVMEECFFPDLPEAVHALALWDARTGATIHRESGIHILELPKPPRDVPPETEMERWLRFFREAETVDSENLPDYLRTTEMDQAMKTLETFKEREERHALYEARFYAELVANTERRAREEALAEKAAAEAERAAAEAERAAAEAELAETKAELAETREAEAAARAELANTHGQLERQALEAEALKARLRALGLDPDEG